MDLESKTENLVESMTSAESEFKFAGVRWVIIGMIFLATLINYIDRLTVSVLAPAITESLNLTNTEFGSIATWFLLAYTISQGLSGKLYDRVGIKKGFTVSIIIWSIAAAAHGTYSVMERPRSAVASAFFTEASQATSGTR